MQSAKPPLRQAIRAWARDHAEVMKWCRATADGGDTDAQEAMGHYEKDKVARLKWL